MLKRILILMILLSFVSLLDAKENFKSATYLGISAGINTCRISFTPDVKQNLLTSVEAGFVFRYISEPHLGLQAEINYAGKGWIEDRDSIGTYKRNLEVIRLPLTMAFVTGSKMVRFAFLLGPYLSYLKSESETYDIAGFYLITNPVTTKYLPYYGKQLKSNWEFGFTGGLGVELHTKIGVFGIRATYNHSLTNLFPLNASEFYYETSRSQVLHAGITYFIKL
jgi:hypothetical protein